MIFVPGNKGSGRNLRYLKYSFRVIIFVPALVILFWRYYLFREHIHPWFDLYLNKQSPLYLVLFDWFMCVRYFCMWINTKYNEKRILTPILFCSCVFYIIKGVYAYCNYYIISLMFQKIILEIIFLNQFAFSGTLLCKACWHRQGWL